MLSAVRRPIQAAPPRRRRAYRHTRASETFLYRHIAVARAALRAGIAGMLLSQRGALVRPRTLRARTTRCSASSMERCARPRYTARASLTRRRCAFIRSVQFNDGSGASRPRCERRH